MDSSERTLRAHFLLRDGIPLWSSSVTSTGRVLVNRPPFLDAPECVGTYDDLAEAFAAESGRFDAAFDSVGATHVRTVREDEQGQQHTTEYPVVYPEVVPTLPPLGGAHPSTPPTITVFVYDGREWEFKASAITVPQLRSLAEALRKDGWEGLRVTWTTEQDERLSYLQAEAYLEGATPTISNEVQATPTISIKAESLGLACDLDLRVGDVVTLRVPAWMMRPAPDGKDLASRILEGKVTALTAAGLEFEGHATVRDCEWCHRCGLPIKHPASLRVGYGPTCSDKLGIDWSLEGLDEAGIQSLKDRIKRETYVAGMWLPRRSVSVLERTPAPSTETPEADSDALDLQLMALIREKGSVASKTLGWIERHYGDWYALQPQMKATVLGELQEFPASGAQRPVAPVSDKSDTVVPAPQKQAVAQAWVAGQTIFVASPYSPENAQICRSVRYGRWSPQAPNPRSPGGKPGAWTYPAYPETAAAIAEAWRAAGKALNVDADFTALMEEYAKRREEKEAELSDVI